jgi:hypothetical protein
LRIAVAVFRLRDSRSSVNGAQRVVDLTADVDGPASSVQRYYEEVSYRATPVSPNPAHPKRTTITLLGGSAFGPIDIDYAWGDLFEHPDAKALWAHGTRKGTPGTSSGEGPGHGPKRRATGRVSSRSGHEFISRP